MFFITEERPPRELVAAVTEGLSVLEVAIDGRIPLNHSCGGMGTCGTCRVQILSSPTPLPDRNEIETEMAEDRGFANDERLSCQIQACEGLRVRIPISEEE